MPRSCRQIARPSRNRRPALLAAALALLALPLAPAAPARADQTDSAVFDLQLRGLRAGTLALSGRIEGNAYASAAKLQSSGLLGFLKTFDYDGKANGSLQAGQFTPARYGEVSQIGSRATNAVMDYRAGVPQGKRYTPPRKNNKSRLDPATQGGTVDPLTAAYAVLRDVPADQACNQRLPIFDGEKRAEVVVGPPQASGRGVTCAGSYSRVAGYSKDDMAEKTRFPFTITYVPGAAGMLQVSEVSMDTIYGQGRLKRR